MSEAEAITCQSCGDKGATYTCDLCQGPTCKKCRSFLDPNAFSFMTKIPAHLKLNLYCARCFVERIEPELARYEELQEQAKEIYFLTKAYRGNVRILKKHTTRVSVDDCDDRRETILRLAFKAVELGFNAIIQADIKSQKLYVNSRQSTTWSGSALPATIDGERLELASLKGF